MGDMEEHCADHSAHERAIKAHDKRLDSHSRQLDAFLETLATLKEIERQNQERIDRMDARLEALEAVPGERWEALAKQALIVVVAAVVGYALGLIGL